MRNIAAVLFLALAACGGGSDTPPADSPPLPLDTPPPIDTPPPPDSQTLDLACAANTVPPTTAPNPVSAAGVASSLDIAFSGGSIAPEIEGLDEATINVCVDDCTNADLIASTTAAAAPCATATGCDFTVSAPTGGAPLDVYLKVSRKDVITSNIFPSEPIAADVANVPGITLKPNALSLLALAGQNQNKGQGMMIVRVSDCALTGVEGSAISLTQNGSPAGDAPFDVGQFDPNLAGTFLVLNVPPGTVTVGATVGATTFRAHDAVVFADELSATQVTPGFAAP